jgi:hypothetical protein
LLGQQAVVPAGDLRQAIVGDHEGALLRLIEMIDVNSL